MESSESEKEIPIEWMNPADFNKFVCDGAKVQCMFCAAPGTLKATSTRIMLQDKPFATEGDKDGKINFNFQGPCMHPSQQKPNVPPPPCKSIISLGEWMNVSKTYIGNDHALIGGSMIVCTVSGAPIRIVHSGQMASLGSLTKLDSPAIGMPSNEKT